MIGIEKKLNIMPTSISLSKENPLMPAEDYVALRKEGFNQVEKLGSDFWTNYNNSDPGITLLEAVCYAITDLGYRTEFNIKDLLAPEKLMDDTWKEIFYTARKILHNAPLTISDYRKLIIDIQGVRNAWIQKSKDYEVPVWIDYNYPYQKKDSSCYCDVGLDKTCYGKLQLNPVVIATYIDGFQQKLTDAKNALGNLSPNATPDDKAAIQTQIDTLTWQIDQLTFDDSSVLIDSKIVEFEGLYNVMIEYEEEILQEQQREEVRAKVVERLAANRNLCEDFLSVDAVEYEDVGAGIFAVLEEYADPDVVLAQIFFTIYKYFTPSIPFHTIQQMLDKGYEVDEIFEGPPLKHGFIDTPELEATDLFRDIRLSDIIGEIADIPGIKAITYLHIPFNGINETGADKDFFAAWIESLQEQRKIARIVPELSQVVFCKQRDVYTYYVGRPQDRRPDRMLKLFRDLKTQESKYKLIGAQLDFAVPAGEYMDLEDYYPVTYSLPRCYGVNDKAGLPSEADDKRKVQALQLKGYLLFFEQLLSGCLVQLNHLKDLFTFDDSVKHNAFTPGLYVTSDPGKVYTDTQLAQIADLKVLLIDHENRGADHWDKILDDFTAVLQNLLETPALFYKRRNRMLNHLLARFSEDMSEYESICRWLIPEKVDERLIKDKIALLKDCEYYKISTRRAKGYDYTQADYWDTPNISGAERRVSRLLGFANPATKTLSTDFITVQANTDGKNIIQLLDPANPQKILLTSVPVNDGCCTELLISQILEHAGERYFYQFLNGKPRRKGQEGSSAPFWFELYDGTDTTTAVLLAKSDQFQNPEDREKTFDRLKVLLDIIDGNEGMHLIEHLLLRPKFDEVLDENGTAINVSFPSICLDACDLGIGLNEGTQVPLYHKKIHRIPAALCYDQMYWVLEYFEYTSTNSPVSILFQKAYEDGTVPDPLKFRTYELLDKRVNDLQEFGSERLNYEIVSNEDEQTDVTKTKYSFIIHGDKGAVLAQSDFSFSKRTDAQIAAGLPVPVPPDDIDEEIDRLVVYFGFEMDLYCAEDPCDNDEDPYSFRATVILPCWPKRLRDHTFRNLVEKTIQREFPAHVHTRIVWLGIMEMKAFETVYNNWLKEMSMNETPQYEAINPLVDKLNNLIPCGVCDDECDG